MPRDKKLMVWGFEVILKIFNSKILVPLLSYYISFLEIKPLIVFIFHNLKGLIKVYKHIHERLKLLLNIFITWTYCTHGYYWKSQDNNLRRKESDEQKVQNLTLDILILRKRIFLTLCFFIIFANFRFHKIKY